MFVVPKYKFDQIAFNSTEKKKPTEDDKYTYIGLEHLVSGCLEVTRYGSDVAPIGEKLVMRKGDVLFGKRRAYQKKVAIAPFDGIFSAHGLVLRPKEDVVDRDFFPFFISSDYFLDAAIKISVGSLSPTINWRELKELEFELPELPIQRDLAKIFMAMNEAKKAYKELITQTEQLVQSQFIEMFGDYLTEDRMSKLESCCDCFCDGDWIESKDQSDSGIRLIQTGNVGMGDFLNKGDHSRFISENTFARLNCTEVLEGDILISRLPDPIGRACIVPGNLGKTITAVDCTIIRLKDTMLPNFLIAYTKTSVYMAQIDSFTTGSTRKRISRGNLGSIAVPVPEIELQRRFCELVEQFDKSKSLCELTAQNRRMGGVRCA